MAKQSKKLTRDQKELLERRGYEPCVTRFIEDRNGTLIFLDVNTGKEFTVEKEEVTKTPVFRTEARYMEDNSDMGSFEYNLFN